MNNKALTEEDLVETILPPEEAFMPTPQQTSAQLRTSKKNELIEFFKLKELKQEWEIAFNYIIANIENQPREKREQFYTDFKKIIEYTANSDELDLDTAMQLSKKLEVSPTLSEVLDEFIIECYERKDYITSAALSSLLCMVEMTAARGWYLRSFSCIELKQYEKAACCLNTIISLYPDQGPAYLYLAECLLQLGEKEQALECAKLATEKLNPQECNELHEAAIQFIKELNNN